jgi:hypothetical protein
MQQSGAARGGPVKATPEDRVVHLAKRWREADKALANSKTPENGTKEYRARQALRDAIDKLPP